MIHDQQPDIRQTPMSQPKLEWVKPEVLKIDAGSAEVGGDTSVDAGGNFS